MSWRTRHWLLASLLPLVLQTGAVAEDSDDEVFPACAKLADELETLVYFGNGVLTEVGEADEAAEELNLACKSRLDSLRDHDETFRDEIYTLTTAYNPTVTEFADTAEVLIQKAVETGADPQIVQDFTGIGLLYSAFPKDTDREAFLDNAIRALANPQAVEERYKEQLLDPEFNAELREAFREYVVERLSDLNETNSKIEDQYIQALKAGKRVIVIPHSQGNSLREHDHRSSSGGEPR